MTKPGHPNALRALCLSSPSHLYIWHPGITRRPITRRKCKLDQLGASTAPTSATRHFDAKQENQLVPVCELLVVNENRHSNCPRFSYKIVQIFCLASLRNRNEGPSAGASPTTADSRAYAPHTSSRHHIPMVVLVRESSRPPPGRGAEQPLAWTPQEPGNMCT